MKKKIGWIAGVLALVALTGGASVLYNKYSNEPNIHYQKLNNN